MPRDRNCAGRALGPEPAPLQREAPAAVASDERRPNRETVYRTTAATAAPAGVGSLTISPLVIDTTASGVPSTAPTISAPVGVFEPVRVARSSIDARSSSPAMWTTSLSITSQGTALAFARGLRAGSRSVAGVGWAPA